MRAALACLLVLACLCPAAAQARVRGVDSLATHAMVYLDSPPSFKAAMFAQTAALGAAAIRVDVAVPEIATAPDQRWWGDLDDDIALARRYRLGVMATLLGTPSWLAECPRRTPTADPSRCPARDEAAYAALVHEIVLRARGAIDAWQVLSEPDNAQVWYGHVGDYARRLIALSRAIRSADPGARVVLAALGSPDRRAWLQRLLATPGVRGSFDVAAVDLRGGLAAVVRAVPIWREFMAERGFDGPLWVTEHGYPAERRFQWDPLFRGGQEAQARYLGLSLPLLLAAGADRVFVTLRDSRGGPWATEGLLGGDVMDPPQPDPRIVPRRAAGVFQAFARSLPSTAPDHLLAAAAPCASACPQPAASPLAFDRRCYSPGQVMTLSGAGYPPGASVPLSLLTTGTDADRTLWPAAPLVADAGGAILARFLAPAPALPADARQRLTAIAGGVAQATLATPTVRLHGTTVVARGFAGAAQLWATYRRRGRVLAVRSVGRLSGPCGGLRARLHGVGRADAVTFAAARGGTGVTIRTRSAKRHGRLQLARFVLSS